MKRIQVTVDLEELMATGTYPRHTVFTNRKYDSTRRVGIDNAPLYRLVKIGAIRFNDTHLLAEPLDLLFNRIPCDEPIDIRYRSGKPIAIVDPPAAEPFSSGEVPPPRFIGDGERHYRHIAQGKPRVQIKVSRLVHEEFGPSLDRFRQVDIGELAMTLPSNWIRPIVSKGSDGSQPSVSKDSNWVTLNAEIVEYLIDQVPLPDYTQEKLAGGVPHFWINRQHLVHMLFTTDRVDEFPDEQEWLVKSADADIVDRWRGDQATERMLECEPALQPTKGPKVSP